MNDFTKSSLLRKVLLFTLSLFASIVFNSELYAQCAPNGSEAANAAINPLTCTYQQVDAGAGIGSGSQRIYTGFTAGDDVQLYFNINSALINCQNAQWLDGANNPIGGWFALSTNAAAPTAQTVPVGASRLRVATSNTGWNTNSALLNYRFPTPTAVTVAGGGPVCSYDFPHTVTASGGAGGTIYWQNTTSNGTSTASPSVSQSVAGPGTYYFRSRGANGCWGAQGSAAVTAGGAQNLSAGANQTLDYCQGLQTTLAGTTTSVINGSQTFGPINTSGQDCNNIQSTGTITGLPADAVITSIVWSASIGNTCTSWYYYRLYVNGVQNGGNRCNLTNQTLNDLNGQLANGNELRIQSFDNDAFCDNITLSLTFTVNYTYSPVSATWSGGPIVSGANTLNPVVNPTTTTTYFLSTLYEGCVVTDDVTVNINPITSQVIGSTDVSGATAPAMPACGDWSTAWCAGSGTHTELNLVNGVNYSVENQGTATCGSALPTAYIQGWGTGGTCGAYSPLGSPGENTVSFNANHTGTHRINVSSMRCQDDLNTCGGGRNHDFTGRSAVLRYRQNTTVTNTTPTAYLCPGETVVMTATLGGGHNNPAIEWSIVSGGGSIAGNVYTSAGNGNVVLRATVGNCFSDVTLDTDTEDPVAVCQNVTLDLDASGNHTIVPLSLDGGSTDNCSIVNRTASPSVLDCSNLGTPVDVTLTVFDYIGNSNTCISQVTIVDNVNPIANCKDTVIFLDEFGDFTINGNFVNDNSTDNCSSIASLVVSPNTFDCTNIGVPNPVILTVTDPSGNFSTCAANVTVIDTIAPVIIPPAAIVVSMDPGECFATGLTFGTPVVTDACGVASVTNDDAGAYGIGDHDLTWTAVDIYGNTSTATQLITVIDTEFPIVITQNITVPLGPDGLVEITPSMIDNGTSDNCTFTMVVSPNIFGPSNIGDNNVLLVATDGSGNTSVGPAIVTIEDDLAPAINTKDITIALDANGNATITPDMVNDGTTDNSGNFTLSLDIDEFECSDLGANTVQLTAVDGSGNSVSAPATVTVIDNTAPSISNISSVSVLADLGMCSASGVDLGLVTADDNCSVTLSNDAPVTFPIGNTMVTWTATDGSGNTTLAQQLVTVVDDQSPTILAPLDVVASANNSCYAFNVALGTPTVSDNCTGWTVSNDAPTIFNLGNTVVTWIVTDASGNSATATQTVTIEDNTYPAIVPPVAVTVIANNDCEATGVNLGTPLSVSDNCGIASVSNDAPTTFPLGTTTVVWSVEDNAGNITTATQVVNVIDNIAPVIAGVVNITVDVDNASCEASSVDLGNVTATDNCTVTLTNDAPTTFQIGTTTVTWTAEDANGNITTVTQTVTVQDDVIPTITAPADITASTNSACFALNVPLGSPVVDDNCLSTLTITNDAPVAFNLGNTTVTWTVVDASGNSASATQVVTIVDTINPVIIAPSAVTVPMNGNCVATGVNLGTPITSDNCGIASVTNDAPTEYSAGTTTVTWTVEDNAGNVSTAFQTVYVEDNESPVVNLNNITVQLDSTGNASITFEDIDAGSSDNCGIVNVVISQTEFNCGYIGTNYISVTLYDANNNSSTGNAIVTIITDGIDADNNGIPDVCDEESDVITALVPEAFTPNGNNINDYFVIGNLDNYATKKLDVFNRYGNSVYSTDSYQNDWDGTRSDNGKPLPDGIYYYLLELDNNEIMKGFVYINRVKQ